MTTEWTRGDGSWHCQYHHLHGAIRWGGTTITYGVVGVNEKQWTINEPEISESRVAGMEQWAKKQTEQMLIAAYAEGRRIAEATGLPWPPRT